MKFVATVIPLVEFDICSIEVEYDIISGICNSSIGKIISIGDNTILLHYGHQFIGSLHAMDSRSQT